MFIYITAEQITITVAIKARVNNYRADIHNNSATRDRY